MDLTKLMLVEYSNDEEYEKIKKVLEILPENVVTCPEYLYVKKERLVYYFDERISFCQNYYLEEDKDKIKFSLPEGANKIKEDFFSLTFRYQGNEYFFFKSLEDSPPTPLFSDMVYCETFPGGMLNP